MYAIFDDFNRSIISRHRTIQNAAKAKVKFVGQFHRHNPSKSYVPVILTRLDSLGTVLPATDDEHCEFCRLLDRD